MTKDTPIWDLPVRVFHWSLPVLLGTAWASAELGEMEIHEWSGYALITLVLFRVIWGIIGSTHARFSDFVRGPRAVVAYLRSKERSEGHNPAGGWAILTMLGLIMLQTGSGLFNSDDVLLFGPLYHLVDSDVASLMHDIHEVVFNLLLAVVGLHVGTVIYYRLVRKQDLITPMITGGRTTLPSAHQAPAWLAVLIITALGLALWWALALVPAPSYLY